MWKVNVTSEFDRWFSNLTRALKKKILSRMYLLELYGSALGRPYADTVKGSQYPRLKELRIKSGKTAIRVFYLIDENREVLLLTGGIKKGKRQFYKKMIKKADYLYTKYREDTQS